MDLWKVLPLPASLTMYIFLFGEWVSARTRLENFPYKLATVLPVSECRPDARRSILDTDTNTGPSH